MPTRVDQATQVPKFEAGPLSSLYFFVKNQEDERTWAVARAGLSRPLPDSMPASSLEGPWMLSYVYCHTMHQACCRALIIRSSCLDICQAVTRRCCHLEQSSARLQWCQLSLCRQIKTGSQNAPSLADSRREGEKRAPRTTCPEKSLDVGVRSWDWESGAGGGGGLDVLQRNWKESS